MKIIPFPDKKFSWLQWPVTLKNCQAAHLHCTAKFFGEVAVDPFAVIARCPKQLSVWFSKEFKWTPSMFAAGHVLHLTMFPQEMLALHEEFAIIPDQFTPWKPHISVPRNYWIAVDADNRTPEDEELKFGELELCLGNTTATVKGQGDDKCS